MALRQKQQYCVLKLSVTSRLAAEFRAVKQAAEAAGFEFDFEEEFFLVLKQMRAQVSSAVEKSSHSKECVVVE